MLAHLYLLISEINQILVPRIWLNFFLLEHHFPSHERADEKPQNKGYNHEPANDERKQSVLNWLAMICLVLIVLLSVDFVT